METKQFTRRSFIGATGTVALAGMGMGSMAAFADEANPAAELRRDSETAAAAFAEVEDFPVALTPATDEHPGMEGVEQVLLDRATLHGGIAVNSRDPERDVDDAQIALLLRAAMTAPTVGDQRSLHYIVIRDPESMDKINGWQLGGNCPVCIAIVSEGCPAACDAGMAATAMMVQASAMGICTCVQGQGFSATDSEGNRKDYSYLGLNDDWYPEVHVSLGYPAVDAYASASVDVYDESHVHQEKI